MSGVAFLCTLNNPTSAEDPRVILETIYKTTPKTVYLCGQLEKGAQGTPHLQFYIHFSQKVRITHLGRHIKHTHFEPVRRDNGAADYCMKEDTRLAGPFEFGTKPLRRAVKADMATRNAAIIQNPIQAV